MDTQASQSVVVFLNGNYYGIYQLMEVLSEDYIHSHYNVNKEDVEIFKTLDHDFDYIENDHYKSLYEYAKNNDLSLAKHYTYIASIIDIGNLLEYFVFQMYIANTDWPAANNKLWRIRDHEDTNGSDYLDGKYRYVLYDTDCGMNRTGDFRFDSKHPTMFHWVFENKYPNNIKINTHSFDVIEELIKNDDFQQAFLNKFCDRVNVDYRPEVFCKYLDTFVRETESEILNDLFRYYYLSRCKDAWYGLIDVYRDYVSKRHETVFVEMAEYFNCDIAKLNILKSPNGYVDINNNINVGISEDFSGKYMSGVDIVLTPIADDGYRFVRWSDGNTDKIRHITFNKNMLELSLEAIFEKRE